MDAFRSQRATAPERSALHRISTRTLKLAAVLSALPVATLPSQQLRTDTATVEQRVLLTPDLTQREVKRRAVENALAEAVRRVAGVRVQSTTMTTKDERNGVVSDEFRSVVQLDAAGRAVDYDILTEEWVTTRHPSLGAQVYYRVVLVATVATETGSLDPSFRLDLSLSANTLHVRSSAVERNDELVATIISSQPSQLILLGLADDSVQVLLPNQYTGSISLPAGARVQVPSAEWRERGLRLRASLPASQASRRELLFAVATRGSVAPFAGGTTIQFQRWLAGIPLDQRAVAFAGYEVVRQ
jgi:hypothetical protein